MHEPAPDRPHRLRLYPSFKTDSVEECAVYASAHWRRVHYHPTDGSRFQVKLNTAELSTLTIVSAYAQYAHECRCESDNRVYMLSVAHEGGWLYENNGQKITAERGEGIFITPGLTFAKSSGPVEQTIVVISQDVFQREAQKLIGQPLPSGPFIVDGRVRLAAPVLRLVEYCVAELDHPKGIFRRSPLAGEDLQHAILSAIILDTPNNYAALSCEETSHKIAYWHVRRCQRAMEYMDAHLAEPVSLADLAEAVGIGARALEQSFHLYLRKSPFTVLRDKRLDRIHDQLLRPRPGTNVKALMHAYGIHHGGEFARHYNERFHEHPSVTFRKGLRRS